MSDPRRLPIVPAGTVMLSPEVARVFVSRGIRGFLERSYREDGQPMPVEIAAPLDALDLIANNKTVVPCGIPGTTRPSETCIVPTVPVDTAADALNVSTRRVRTLIAEGQLEAKRSPRGHAWLIARSSLDELIAQRIGETF